MNTQSVLLCYVTCGVLSLSPSSSLREKTGNLQIPSLPILLSQNAFILSFSWIICIIWPLFFRKLDSTQYTVVWNHVWFDFTLGICLCLIVSVHTPLNTHKHAIIIRFSQRRPEAGIGTTDVQSRIFASMVYCRLCYNLALCWAYDKWKEWTFSWLRGLPFLPPVYGLLEAHILPSSCNSEKGGGLHFAMVFRFRTKILLAFLPNHNPWLNNPWIL